jgi:hypothetical protein
LKKEVVIKRGKGSNSPQMEVEKGEKLLPLEFHRKRGGNWEQGKLDWSPEPGDSPFGIGFNYKIY